MNRKLLVSVSTECEVDLHAHFFSTEFDAVGSVFFNSTNIPCGELLTDGSLRLQLTENCLCAISVSRTGHSIRDAALTLRVTDCSSGDELIVATFEANACRAPAPAELAARGASPQLQRLVGGIAAVPSLFLAVLDSTSFKVAGIRCTAASPPAICAEIQQLLLAGEALDEAIQFSDEVHSHHSGSLTCASSGGLVYNSEILRFDRSRSSAETLQSRLDAKERQVHELQLEVSKLKTSLEIALGERAVFQADFEEILRRALQMKLQLDDSPVNKRRFSKP